MTDDKPKYPTRDNPMIVHRREKFFVCDEKSYFGPCKCPEICTRNGLCGESFAT